MRKKIGKYWQLRNAQRLDLYFPSKIAWFEEVLRKNQGTVYIEKEILLFYIPWKKQSIYAISDNLSKFILRAIMGDFKFIIGTSIKLFNFRFWDFLGKK